MTNGIDLKSKFLGAMLGSALGDAIGELAFRGLDQAALRAAVARSTRLIYTDDTAMAIGLAQSLAQRGRLDPGHLGDTFRANFQREPWRGYASGPPTIFSLVARRELSYADAARSLFGGTGSYGNGAAMRIAPLGLFFRAAPDLYTQARASAAVTHAHPVGIDGAAVQAQAVAQAVQLDPQEPFPRPAFIQGLLDLARTPEMRDKLALVRDLVAADAPPSQAARRLGQSVAVHQSLPFALYAFLRQPDSFADCLFCAVLHGGDRDTLGAMACAISGAYLGVDTLPPDWRAKLENRALIEDLALKLAELQGCASF